MPTQTIPFYKTSYFSNLITDYVAQDDKLKGLYNYFPTIENFKLQIKEKTHNYNHENRRVLVHALLQQYQGLSNSEASLANIESLQKNTTFTVTTGHQLNLFTGPLYFLYKIITTINLSNTLKQKYPNYHFVPIFWMATEDHDFNEINFFNFKRKKIQWNSTQTGAVGAFSTENLEAVLNILSQELGTSINAQWLSNLFKTAYLKHPNLASATRYIAHSLFGKYGLVVLDAQTPQLKTCFIPQFKKELFSKVCFSLVTKTNQYLKTNHYPIQVNPREINLFYLTENLRERIIFDEGVFKIANTNLTFTQKAIEKELENHPERFSPNVITRPLYQEALLPNLCYIGGGGELAYWLQLKKSFEDFGVAFPMLLLRNALLIQSKKQAQKLEKLGVSTLDLFLSRNDFINKYVRKISNINIDFTNEKSQLQKQFTALYKLAAKTDQSFLGAVKAQEAKQINGLLHLEKRLLNAQKRKLKDHIIRATDLQEQLFPYQQLQERYLNFSEMYLEYGENLIPTLINSLQPLEMAFTVATL